MLGNKGQPMQTMKQYTIHLRTTELNMDTKSSHFSVLGGHLTRFSARTYRLFGRIN